MSTRQSFRSLLAIAPLCLSLSLHAQASVALGSVDGRPLVWNPDRTLAVAKFRAEALRPPTPADEPAIADLLRSSRCEYVKAEIRSAAEASAVRRFAISVSQQ